MSLLYNHHDTTTECQDNSKDTKIPKEQPNNCNCIILFVIKLLNKCQTVYVLLLIQLSFCF